MISFHFHWWNENYIFVIVSTKEPNFWYIVRSRKLYQCELLYWIISTLSCWLQLKCLRLVKELLRQPQWSHRVLVYECCHYEIYVNNHELRHSEENRLSLSLAIRKRKTKIGNANAHIGNPTCIDNILTITTSYPSFPPTALHLLFHTPTYFTITADAFSRHNSQHARHAHAVVFSFPKFEREDTRNGQTLKKTKMSDPNQETQIAALPGATSGSLAITGTPSVPDWLSTKLLSKKRYLAASTGKCHYK